MLLLSAQDALGSFAEISLKVMQDETIGWLILVCGGFGALMSASAFGSQACFYSDSTVLAARFLCGC